MTIFNVILIGFLMLGASTTVSAQIAKDSIISVDTGKQELASSNDSTPSYTISEEKLPTPIPDSLFGSSYASRKVSPNQAQSYQTDPDYAYANDSAYWRKEPAKKPIGNKPNGRAWGKYVQWVLFILLGVVIVFGIIQLISENGTFGFFRRRGGKRSESPPSEEAGEIDYDAAIQKYQEEKNYRMAIRYMYLRLINSIRSNGQVKIQQSSTNADILSALKDHPRSAELMFLVFAYERAFFGALNFKPESYEYIKYKFDDFQKFNAG